MRYHIEKVRNDDHELATKGFLRNEFKQELKDELVPEIAEMVDVKLQGVVDIFSKQLDWIISEIRLIHEDNQRFWRKFDSVD